MLRGADYLQGLGAIAIGIVVLAHGQFDANSAGGFTAMAAAGLRGKRVPIEMNRKGAEARRGMQDGNCHNQIVFRAVH
jgi:hypothetical protein